MVPYRSCGRLLTHAPQLIRIRVHELLMVYVELRSIEQLGEHISRILIPVHFRILELQMWVLELLDWLHLAS